jgi:hypothetical protein
MAEAIVVVGRAYLERGGRCDLEKIAASASFFPALAGATLQLME